VKLVVGHWSSEANEEMGSGAVGQWGWYVNGWWDRGTVG
jgi:hypothetical protein